MGIETRALKAAIIKGATWLTAAQAGAAGCGISPTNPGAPKLSWPVVEIDELTNPNENALERGNVNPCDFNLDFNYRWDGLENILLAMLMGTAGAPTGAGTAKTHVLAMADSVFGKFVTYAVEKGTKIHVVPSAKVIKASFTFNNGLLKVTFGLRGCYVTDADGVVTSLASVTFPTIQSPAKACNAVFRLNVQGGDALAAGDKIYPKTFTIDIERKVDGEHAAGSKYILEPVENGKPQVKLSMEFARQSATEEAWFANWVAEGEKKADVEITGAAIAGGGNYSIKFEFPRLFFEDLEFPPNPIIPAKVSFRALVAAAAPTGMTGLTKPVTITVVNTRATDLLG